MKFYFLSNIYHNGQNFQDNMMIRFTESRLSSSINPQCGKLDEINPIKDSSEVYLQD